MNVFTWHEPGGEIVRKEMDFFALLCERVAEGKCEIEKWRKPASVILAHPMVIAFIKEFAKTKHPAIVVPTHDDTFVHGQFYGLPVIKVESLSLEDPLRVY